MWGLGRGRCCWPTAWSRCWFMARRALSTQGSRGAPKGACREEAGVRGDTSCRRHLEEGAGLGAPWCRAGPRHSEGSTLGKGNVALPSLLLSQPPSAGQEQVPQTQEGCFTGRGCRDREHSVPAPTSPPTRTPSSRPTPQGKTRPSAPWAEENRAGSLASSGFHLPAPSPLGSRT